MRKAAALRYERGRDRAPQLIASGQGLLAERILEMAAKSDIPLHVDRELVDGLLALPIGSEIPPELYQLVAQVFAFVMRLDEENSRNKSGKGDGQS